MTLDRLSSLKHTTSAIAWRASDLDEDQVRREALRLPLHLCYYNPRLSALTFMGGFGRNRWRRMQPKQTVRCMRNLQRPYLQGFTVSC